VTIRRTGSLGAVLVFALTSCSSGSVSLGGKAGVAPPATPAATPPTTRSGTPSVAALTTAQAATPSSTTPAPRPPSITPSSSTAVALAQPPPTPAATPPPTPLPTLAVNIRTVDFRNVTLPARSCKYFDWQSPEPIPLVDGKGTSGDPNQTYTSSIEVEGVDTIGFADFDRDGNLDALLSIGCSGGGIHVETVVVPISIANGQLELVAGSNIIATYGHDAGTGDSRLRSARIEGDNVVVREVVAQPGEARCCYTGTADLLWRVDGNLWTHEVRRADLQPEVSGPTATDAAQVLRSYFLTAGARNYSDAWAMLTDRYKAKYTSFSKFQSFWDSIQYAGIDGTSAIGAVESGGVAIAADVWYTPRSKPRSNEAVRIEVIRSASGALMIDDYTFISQR
jgi:hypothetical protein